MSWFMLLPYCANNEIRTVKWVRCKTDLLNVYVYKDQSAGHKCYNKIVQFIDICYLETIVNNSVTSIDRNKIWSQHYLRVAKLCDLGFINEIKRGNLEKILSFPKLPSLVNLKISICFWVNVFDLLTHCIFFFYTKIKQQY